jgi:dihydropyrimidinase
MTMADIIIRDGKVVTHTDIFEADVAIEGEKIAAIGKGLGKAKEEIDAKGNYVMPGCIDPHVHLGVFTDYEEDMKSETAAAAAGGTTTIMHLLFANTPIVETYERCRAPIEKLATCDVSFYGALLTNDDLKQIEKLTELGVPSYKLLLAYKGKAADSIGLKNVNIDNGYMYSAFEILKKTGGMAMIHAENTEVIFAIEPRFKKDNTLKTWADARPNIAEELDLYTGCKIAEEVGVPLYQVHSSVGTAPQIVKEFRERGNKVFLETCPTYFLLDYYGKNMKVDPKLGKINPPIRSPKDREMVLEGLKAGQYDTIGTDTCGSFYEKKWADGNIWNIVLDWSDIEYMFPLVLSECVNKGHLTLPQAVKLLSYNTAKIQGLYPKKGVMAAGSDADILIVDLKKKKTVNQKKSHSYFDYTVYDGWEITGWPVLTMIRGKVVVKDDKMMVEPGYGRYVKREAPFKK